MNKKILASGVFLSLVLASLACEAANTSKSPAQEAQTTVVQAVTSAAPTATEDSAATAAAEKMIQGTNQAEKNNMATYAAATAQAQSATLAAKSVTQTVVAKQTQQAGAVATLTESVKAQVTQEASAMYGLVDTLHKEGVLKRTLGTYHTVEDFEESWAKIGWYQWWKTGLESSNFVLRAHTTWESASKTADWWASGCGFVFREADENNHYMVFLALDGFVYLQGFVDGKYRDMGREYYQKVGTTQGEADIVLVAEDNKISYYIDGKKVFSRTNDYFKEGALGLTLISGTNKDYGIRCGITNIEVWDLGR